MIKRVILFIFFLNIMILSAGCWDRRPVDKLVIIDNLTIDKSLKTEDSIKVNIIRPSFEEDKEEFAHTRTAESDSIMGAIKKIQNIESKVIVFGHVNTVLLTKSLAKEGLQKILAQIDRITGFDTDAFVVILDGDISEIEKFHPPNQKRTGILILDTIETATKRQFISDVTFYKLMNTYMIKGKEIVLPIVSIQFDKDNFKIEGNAVFKGDKMIGSLNLKEVIPYMLIVEKIDELEIDIPKEYTIDHGIENLSVIIRDNNVKIKTKVEDNVPIININIKLLVDIQTYSTSKPFNLKDNINYISQNENIKIRENIISKYLENESNNLIVKTQKELKSDIFGFGEKFRIQNNNFFINNDWSKLYFRAKITTDIEVKLRKLGTVK